MRNVYITATGAFLPGPPVQNENITDYIGAINDQSERLGRLILRQNKIKTRHYVSAENGEYIFSNADLAAFAAKETLNCSSLNSQDLSLLATATTQGDLLVPGHGSAVHAKLAEELPVSSLEVASFQSVCASSIMALKHSYLNIGAGLSTNALATGSEFSSRWFQPNMYIPAIEKLEDKEVRMSAEFLRWTLSDGAGAVLIQDKPTTQNQNFKIDWIKSISLADRFDTCMYAGISTENRFIPQRAWSMYEDGPPAAILDGAVMLLQDMVLLKRIIRAWVGEYLSLVDEGLVNPHKIDHLLCHYSAHSLREEIIAIMKKTGGMIDEEKWFTNLSTKGNTGSAAIFVMLDEFAQKNIARPGEKILCIVPESGRAMIGFIMLTAL